MLAVLRLVAHKLRAGWRGWAALAAITALAGGAVLTAAAGAIRTDTAYPRFIEQSNASDALVAPAGSGAGGYDAALGRLPGVAASAALVGINAVPVSAAGVPDQDATMSASLDGRYGRTVDIPKLLAGRLPVQNAPGEIAVDQIAAQQLSLRVGRYCDAAFANPRPRPLTEHVVGVFVTPLRRPRDGHGPGRAVWEPRALPRAWPRLSRFDGAYVTLKPGTSLAALTAAAESLAKRYPSTGGQLFVADERTQEATVERAIRPQAVTLGLFALALALTALLIVGQVASRALLAGAGDNGALAALGMTRRQQRLARAGAPATAVTGVRFALDPGAGRAALPVRSAMLGLAVAVAAVAGAGTFGANLLRLVDTPRLVAFWQVATVTAIALAVGVPLGIAGGRWAWQVFAGQAGLPNDAITPLPVLWMIPATLLVAALVALPPARSVAGVPAAATLRSE